MTTPPHDLILDARGLCFDYGDFRAVDEVDLQVHRGEIHALLGTNGAGKTTTLELLQGYRHRSAGDLRVLGVDPAVSPGVLRERTGVMLQEAGLFVEISARATVELWQSLSSRVDEVDRVLEVVDLAHRGDIPVQALSGGERRRLDLALAVWGSPELIVLDEPTTGLDPASRRTLWQIVRGLQADGTSILLTTHYLEEVESLADRVAIMDAGRVAVAGSLDEVLRARPARVTADVDPSAVAPGWLGDPPPGVEVDRAPVQRPDGPREAVTVTSDDHQGALLWLLRAAEDAGVHLGRLRASPASLEEVFLDVRASRFALEEAEPR